MPVFTWETASSYILASIRITIILIVSLLAARYTKKYIALQTARLTQEALRLSLLKRILVYTIYAVAGLMIIRELGIQTTALMGIVGLAGISCGLAIQGSLANFFSGIFLMLEAPYKAGDIITFKEATGKVVETNLYATLLKTADDKIIRVPHDKLIKEYIIIEKK